MKSAARTVRESAGIAQETNAGCSGTASLDHLRPNGFNSTIRTPHNMSAAPTVPRPESTSPTSRNDVIQANTGSIAKIRAVRVGLVQRCAQVWIENATAVAKKLVTNNVAI